MGSRPLGSVASLYLLAFLNVVFVLFVLKQARPTFHLFFPSFFMILFTLNSDKASYSVANCRFGLVAKL